MSVFIQSYSMWREQGVWALMQHVRLVLLRRLHHLALDQKFDSLETVPTSKLLEKNQFKPVKSENLKSAREYTPSPRLVVKWLLDGLQEDLSQFSFVDFGSGRGRVLLAAAEKPFQLVRGVEFCKRLHGEAERNIRDYPKESLNCNDIKSIYADASEYELPAGDCVLYFYNPFDANLLNKVLSNAINTAQSRGSRILIVYYNPAHLEVLTAEKRLRDLSLPLITRLKMKLFSPYPARIFEFNG